MSAREIVALLFRELRLVVVALALPVIAAAMLYLHAPKSYEASAKVLVSGSGAQTLGDAASGGSESTAQETLNSEVEILTGRELAMRTVARIGADRLFPGLPVNRRTGQPDPDAVGAAFARALTVRAVPSSRVINISLLGPTSGVAAEALRDYLDLYQELHRNTFSRPVAALLRGQLQGYEAALQRVEGRIAAFSEANRLFDPEQERRNLLDTRSSLMNTALQLRSHADELAARVGALAALKASTPEALETFAQGDESDAMQRSRAQLLDLQQQRTKLAANYQPTSRAIRDLDGQIASVQAFLAGEARRFATGRHPERNPLYDELTAETARAQAQVAPERDRAASTDAEVAAVDRRLSQMAEAQKTLDPLERERAQDVAAVNAYRQRVADASVSESLNGGGATSVQVIQSAAADALHHPAKPKLLAYLVGGIAAGIALAAAVVGVLFARKNTFLAPESVEARTRIPVLVSLPLREA